MLIRNNNGEVIGEMDTIFTQEGSVVRTNTTHSSGCPVVQNVTVRDTQGNVHTTNVIGGKILP
jgi:protein subunit release factor A